MDSNGPAIESISKNGKIEEFCTGRCVCLHAWSQWVAMALESLLQHHGVVSGPLSTLDEKEAEIAIRLRDALRATLKSRAHVDVREVAVAFGASPFALSHIYRLPVDVCDDVMLEGDERTHCGSPCAALNGMEQRKMARRLFEWFPPEARSAQAVRAYVLVRGSDVILGDDVLEFSPGNAKEEKTLVWGHTGCRRRPKETEVEGIWMRLRYFA